VIERIPRQRMVAFAHPEETAEAHHRIFDAAAALADHQMVDAADLIPVCGIDRRAFDLVGTDQEPAFIALQRAAAVIFPPPVELLAREFEVVAECLSWLGHVAFLSFPDGGRDPLRMLVSCRASERATGRQASGTPSALHLTNGRDGRAFRAGRGKYRRNVSACRAFSRCSGF